MATLWRSHQRCKRCGWAGVTKAHRLNIASGLGYLFTTLALVVLDGLGVLALRSIVVGPAGTVALVWFYGVPLVIWRWNACGGCHQRMKVELLSGHAPPNAASPPVSSGAAEAGMSTTATAG